MTGVWLLSDLMEDWSPAPVLWFSSGSTEAGEFDVRDQSHMNTMLLAADCADTGFDSLYLVNNREHLVLCRSERLIQRAEESSERLGIAGSNLL